MSTDRYSHATCVLIGEHGVLIRGVSGSGKSRLAELLLRAEAAARRFACLVGDDRLRLVARHGRLLATVHPAIAGRRELRGLGLVAGNYEPTARLSLVIELGATPAERMPPSDLHVRLEGIALPLLRLSDGDIGPFAVALVQERLQQLDRNTMFRPA